MSSPERITARLARLKLATEKVTKLHAAAATPEEAAHHAKRLEEYAAETAQLQAEQAKLAAASNGVATINSGDVATVDAASLEADGE